MCNSTLQNNTFSALFVGQNIVTIKTVNSTNTFLKEALSNSAPLPEGTVIMAGEQTAGRGQLDSKWISQPGKNLTFSVLFNPRFLSLPDQFDLNKAVSLGINDVLATYLGDRARIKWPNDCFAGHKKIGGVLIENMISGSQIKHAIIGIGLNINQITYPQSLKNVTSLSKILHVHYDLMALLGEICSALEARYLQLRAGKKQLIHAEYLTRLYGLHEWRPFKINGRMQDGKIVGIAPDGRLEVEFDDGIRRFGFKEIEFVND